MKKIRVSLITIFCLSFGAGIAQLTDIHGFNGPQGSYPWGDLTLSGKTLFGMTFNGGAFSNGCIFSMDTNGNNYKDIFDFNLTNGSEPMGNLVMVGAKLYGLASYGGAYGIYGCAFSIDSDGNNYRDIHDFASVYDGANPTGSLTCSGGVLYGMTIQGGVPGPGTIFSIDTSGSNYSVIYTFKPATGTQPNGSLIFQKGKLFGMANNGGTNDSGSVFSVDSTGKNYKVLVNFTGPNGRNPYGALAVNGNILYGMTFFGGANHKGCIFSVDTDGARYKNMFSFAGANGSNPSGSLIISGKRLYGMTENGGVYNDGCLFSIDTTTNGYNFLVDFNSINNADIPYGSLTLSPSGTFYGMSYGGTVDLGSKGVAFKFRDSSIVTSNFSLSNPSLFTTVYPNPNCGKFIIQSSAIGIRSSVEIYNTLGQLVYKRQITDSSQVYIDLTNQPNGVYFYRVVPENGQLIGAGKVVKE